MKLRGQEIYNKFLNGLPYFQVFLTLFSSLGLHLKNAAIGSQNINFYDMTVSRVDLSNNNNNLIIKQLLERMITRK